MREHHGFTGWRCKFEHGHDGPCGLVPKWWNLKWQWKMWRIR